MGMALINTKIDKKKVKACALVSTILENEGKPAKEVEKECSEPLGEPVEYVSWKINK